MTFLTTLHLQASADVALSCERVRPVIRGGRDNGLVSSTLVDMCSFHPGGLVQNPLFYQFENKISKTESI